MTKKPKVSVIIAVYNVEEYLRQCLESIINQTLRDIEIICVDDGSTDSSSEILKEYEEKDERIIVLKQANSGAGAARNNGLRVARGSYLSFLDSDDIFEINMLEKAYYACVANNSDFVVFGCDRYDTNKDVFLPCDWSIRKYLLPKKDIFSFRDILKDIFRLFNGWAWDKLYNHEFVKASHLQFQEQRTTNDLFFVYAALVKASRIFVIHDILVHQRINNASSLSRTRERSWNCFYQALLALRNELQDMDVFEEVKQSYINYALNFSLWNLKTITGKSYVKLYNYLREEYFEELGITMYSRDYFWSESEYDQYLEIMSIPLRKESPYYRVFKLSNISRIICCLRENSFGYTLNKIKKAIFYKSE